MSGEAQMKGDQVRDGVGKIDCKSRCGLHGCGGNGRGEIMRLGRAGGAGRGAGKGIRRGMRNEGKGCVWKGIQEMALGET